VDFISAKAETIPWEIYHGRLLDAAQTRMSKTLLSWRIAQADNTHTPVEPLIAARFDVHARQIHVTRGLLAYVWEAYDAGGGVIESREVIRWTRELVSTITLAEFADLDSLRDELIATIWHAVVGTSRLPLHSVEAPLPAYVFGQLHYVYRDDAGEQPCAGWSDFIAASRQTPLAWREMVKLVEFTLRHVSPNEVAQVGRTFLSAFPAMTPDLPRLMRALFNEVSLSPHTCLIANALLLIEEWPTLGAMSVAEEIDFLSWLLRHLSRHLTAYDLVTFHHRGANYPDALLLDAALKTLLRRIDTHPELFETTETDARIRRRALRHGCLLRRHYEGHLVPDHPTSPGENNRVMPASHPRLGEEQLTQSLKRRRLLYENEPLASLLSPNARRILALSLRDLEHREERLELGVGLFIDRPLGYAKTSIEPDLTPILAHEAFSLSLARRLMLELQHLAGELGLEPMHLPELEAAPGLSHIELAACPRPVAALADVRKVADDFVILRTLPGGLNELLALFDWQDLLADIRLRFLAEKAIRLCVQT